MMFEKRPPHPALSPQFICERLQSFNDEANSQMNWGRGNIGNELRDFKTGGLPFNEWGLFGLLAEDDECGFGADGGLGGPELASAGEAFVGDREFGRL